MKTNALDLVPRAVMTGVVAVAGIIIGGVALDSIEPKTRTVPVLGNIVTDLRAAWRKVYNP